MSFVVATSQNVDVFQNISGGPRKEIFADEFVKTECFVAY